ncbi:DnaJ domain containing protein [Quillaja saponaria]|uniref:DnaJ domain containing protein n=1 Tax=Quillaja saponaria TaxID=32244 RepID=A0AAD7QEU9_QUISA|nr:DnaJ domain containing protein [Quillaja saponaria]
MDCNKDEAIKAKSIAEQKMQNKDFLGARKIALKAQQLYPDLENIAQMLMVCDVHCSAEKKLSGSEMDWYGILQIEQTSNEATIKKQYRKFALQLHPDKNKFAGAEAAFKLIGEAQRILLDKDKRATYDMIRRKASVNKTAVPYHPPQKASTNFSFGVQNNVRNNFTDLNPQQPQFRQATQQGFNGGRLTFWTACPFCSMRYQYYRDIVNRSLRCQNCNKPFIAYDMNEPCATPASNLSQQSFPQKKDGLDKGAFKVDVGRQRNFNADNLKAESSQKTGSASEFTSEKVNGKRKKRETESSESSDSISSTDSEEDMVIDGDGFDGGQRFEGKEDRYPRRSTRQKQKVSYRENLSDDDDLTNPSKRAKESGSPWATSDEKNEATKMNDQPGAAADVKDEQKEVKQKEKFCYEESLPNRTKGTNEAKVTKEVKGKEEVLENDSERNVGARANCKPDPISKATLDPISKGEQESTSKATLEPTSKETLEPEVYVYPDPDFNDFDKDKNEDCFAVGQIWATYDTADAMPRFYAQIRKVLSPGFKLRITWLEPDPDDEDETNWTNEDLPVSCGKFILGNTEVTGDRLMFSHLISWEKGGHRDTFKVYPRKGETWALFKNWDIKWYDDAEAHRNYDYEFVEVLSDYVEAEGILVAYLGKLKGFVSLFSRVVKQGIDSFQVPPVQLFRFSHRVPSFKMTGKERGGVPKGSYELDPASLPTNIEEVAVSEYLDVKDGHIQPDGLSARSSDVSKPTITSDGNVYTCQADVRRGSLEQQNKGSNNDINDITPPTPFSPEAMEIPEPEFYNFDAEKSPEKFQIGQIWALYSDEDGLPKYYGKIKRIDTQSDFELHVVWLGVCFLPDNTITWHDKKIPICCGGFKTKRGKPNVYSNTKSFSHQLQPDTIGKKNEYAIFPRKGEVWAIYKNWSTQMACSDLENCEYDIVEVLEENDLWREVLVLELVNGYKSVFKGQKKERSAVTMRIPQTELLRFSHQIPSFKLTEEKDGSLRGFWELDPAALPYYYFCLN